ncbi:Protein VERNALIZATION 3 [Ranunculus cassubicifolius]
MPRARVRDPLVLSRVIGDVVDPFHNTVDLKISYGDREITSGCEFKPSLVVNQPRVEIGGFDHGGTFYTLVMVDPDAPSPSNAHQREYLHCPRPTMGIHRFVFVLFQQLGRQTVYAPGWRLNFNSKDFAGLHNLGLPVAVVYFNCQRELGSGGRRF